MKVEMAKQEYAKTISDMYGIFYFVSDKDILNKLDDIAMLIDRNKLLGIVACDKKHTTIKMLVVMKSQRGRGLGKKLFERGCKLLELEKKGMLIEATESPTSSIDFWEKMGFTSIKTILTKRDNKMKIMEYKGGKD